MLERIQGRQETSNCAPEGMVEVEGKWLHLN